MWCAHQLQASDDSYPPEYCVLTPSSLWVWATLGSCALGSGQGAAATSQPYYFSLPELLFFLTTQLMNWAVKLLTAQEIKKFHLSVL